MNEYQFKLLVIAIISIVILAIIGVLVLSPRIKSFETKLNPISTELQVKATFEEAKEKTTEVDLPQ